MVRYQGDITVDEYDLEVAESQTSVDEYTVEICSDDSVY